MENLKKKIQDIVNLYKSEKFSEAELQGKELITHHPKVSFLYNFLGLVMIEQKKHDEALNFFEAGIKIKPDYAMIYNNLGMLYAIKNDYIKAENYYKKSINLDYKLYEAQNNLGNLYIDVNKYENAIDCFINSINIKPNSYIAHYNLGVAYKSIGKFVKSKNHLKQSIKLYPQFCKAHRTLSQISKYKKSDAHFNTLKKLYLDTKHNDLDRMEIAFGLAKAYEDIKDFSNAFKCCREGNKIRRKNIVFSIKKEKEEFIKIKNFFSRETFNQYKDIAIADNTPIFILGMPRSGTTLVEQIISSHSKVFGGDELNFFNNLIKKYLYRNGILSTRDIVKGDSDNFVNVGKQYINSIKQISTKERMTDKLPINFKWIGFIKLILPNSKIVHCIRDSKDTCLSIYKNYFTNTELGYAYNCDELVNFYNLYSDLMKFWNKILPKYIIKVEYEKLIKNPKHEIKTLIKSCGLEWDEKCLKFYNNKRAIKTASDVQARNKIYKSSINSWKNYKKYLDKCFSGLNV